ncbi:metal-response element-binding transcription factor 2-like isoform X2 [Liolophura sinensis]|uniref:metal-response element-binding transcription factor 2-like isoform X2 n=1 Tax=Liolophura sinensis TaxID=3198878 RepID=UPI0031598591
MSGRERKRGVANRSSRQAVCPVFAVSQDVLIRWNDGLFYLGSVIQVDDQNKRCFVKFEDNSQHWAMFKDISKANNGEICCCLCRDDVSDRPNEIVLCDNCGLGYHQRCHIPKIEPDVLRPDVVWLCRLCVFATTVKRGGAIKSGPNAEALQKIKQTLPYRIRELTWDSQHKTNLENCYCYCGGPGEWYRKMLQCCRCNQWFHEACLQCLDYPVLYGDRWHIFVCSLCNFGVEYVKRLELKWLDVAQLALFNLTIIHNRKYFDLSDMIIPWVKENWDSLQLSQSMFKNQIFEEISSSLTKNKYRFQSGKEIKKKFTLFGLRVRLPPPPPTVIVPDRLLISDNVIDSVKVKTQSGVQSLSPVPRKYGKRKQMLDPVNSTSDKAKKFMKTATVTCESKDNGYSPNQQYKGYTNDRSEPLNGAGGRSTRKSPSKQSGCSLDSIIPLLHSYAGHNHPFKTALEQTQELEKQKLKSEWLRSYQNGYDTDSTSQSSQAEDMDKELTDANQNLPMNGWCVRRKHRRKVSHQNSEVTAIKVKTEPLDPDDLDQLTSPVHACAMTRSFKNNNVVDTATIEAVRSKEVSVQHLRSSVCHYFGRSERLAQGEQFQVIAKRVTPDNKVQYLLEWDGLVG